MGGCRVCVGVVCVCVGVVCVGVVWVWVACVRGYRVCTGVVCAHMIKEEDRTRQLTQVKFIVT